MYEGRINESNQNWPIYIITRKLTQAALAEKLGITDRDVSKWERGKGLFDALLMIVSMTTMIAGIFIVTFLIPKDLLLFLTYFDICIFFLIPCFYALKLEINVGAYKCKNCSYIFRSALDYSRRHYTLLKVSNLCETYLVEKSFEEVKFQLDETIVLRIHHRKRFKMNG